MASCFRISSVCITICTARKLFVFQLWVWCIVIGVYFVDCCNVDIVSMFYWKSVIAWRDSSSQPIWVPLLGPSLLSEWKGFGHGSIVSPVRVLSSFSHDVFLYHKVCHKLQIYVISQMNLKKQRYELWFEPT